MRLMTSPLLAPSMASPPPPLPALPTGAQPADLCPVERTAWLLDGTAPPTFPDSIRVGEPVLHYSVDSVSGMRASPDCTADALRPAETARWPAALEPWLDAGLLRRTLPPPWQAGCVPGGSAGNGAGGLAIDGASSGEVISRIYQGTAPRLHLRVNGAQGSIGWLVNGKLIGNSPASQGQTVELGEPGAYAITAFDARGHYDRVTISVR